MGRRRWLEVLGEAELGLVESEGVREGGREVSVDKWASTGVET